MDACKMGGWMKQEGAKVEDLALRLQQQILSIPWGSLTGWLRELGARYGHFAAHLQGMMQVEEEGGYLLPVFEQRPTLSRHIDVLRHEHDELRRLMTDLEQTVRGLRPDDQLLIRDCCARLRIFLEHVQRHHEHENHLVQYSFNQDIGTDH